VYKKSDDVDRKTEAIRAISTSSGWISPHIKEGKKAVSNKKAKKIKGKKM
jgi:hypothetical protein